MTEPNHMDDLITHLIDTYSRAIADDGPPTYPRERRAMAAVIRAIAEEAWQRGSEGISEGYKYICNWLHVEADKAEAAE